MGIRTKFNPMGGTNESEIYEPEPIQEYKRAYLVSISGSRYSTTAPTISVTDLTSKITTSGATKCGQVSAKFILLGGRIYNTTSDSFISDIEGFTSIGCGYTGILALKDGVIYCFNTSGTLLYTDSSLKWKSVEAPIYMYGDNYRKWFYALTVKDEVYEITIGDSALSKTLLTYADRFPHGGNYYDSKLNYLKGTTVYTSTGSSVLTDVTACVGCKSSYLPSSYKTDTSKSNVRTALLAVKSDGIYMLASTTNTKILSGTNCMVSNMGLSANGWDYSDGRTHVFWPLISNGTAYIVQTAGATLSTGISNTKFIEGGIYTTSISSAGSTSSSSTALCNSAIIVDSSNRVYVAYGATKNSYNEPASVRTVQVSGITGDVVGVYGGMLKFLIITN